jgi:ribosomal protein L37E
MVALNKKCTRLHVKCRECGDNHSNPASSSLCVPCGVAARTLRKEMEAQEVENSLEMADQNSA